MTSVIVKCLCHESEACDKQVEGQQDVFFVCCAEDPTKWTLYGDADAVKYYATQMIAQRHLENDAQGKSSTNDSIIKRLSIIFENPEEAFNDFFYK